ncbi:MAG: DUF3467 domain-containing protein [Chloroflexi bacterium]|nr:MAG: DUF3467 domain-containing protein [Chloroflexota bacterium]
MTNPSQPGVPPPKRINLELPANLEATYANLALINQSASEIIIDFARVMPNINKSKIYSRIVMTPLNAKLLHRALAESLSKYEAKYGEITIPENIAIDPNRGFVK